MALTDTAARNAKWSGKESGDKLPDGDGMYLLVKQAGKYWRMDFRHDGKRNTLALGVYPAVGLAEARRARDKARKLLEQGINPSLHRKAEKLQRAANQANSFQAVATQWLAHWSVGKEEHSVTTKLVRLERDIYPLFGALPIKEVTTPMIVSAVQAVMARGTRDTAERVLTACRQVFRYAIAHSMADRNPANDVKAGDILPAVKVKNHARVSAKQMPDLLRAIHGYGGERMTIVGLQLLCLTFVRTGELVGARWDELDLKAGRWEIPGERMKMEKPHIVPLCRQAVALFRHMQAMNGHHPHVFYSSRSKSRHMSDGTMLQALYRMGYKGIMTGHGFRGLASTIMHEAGFQHEHIEAQLSHQKRDKVSAAYDHSQYLKQRTAIMQWWGDYVQNCTEEKVIALPRRTA